MGDVEGPAEEVSTREEEERKKVEWEAKQREWEAKQFNWTALKAEFTWEKLWTNRTWKDIFGHFAKVLFLTVIPTLFDMTTDALNGINFVVGADYMKRAVNLSDPLNQNCTHIGTYLKHAGHGESWTEYEDLSCHEKDPIWGYVTLGLICLSGFHSTKEFIFPRMKRAWKEGKFCTAIFWFLCWYASIALACSVFPLVLVGVHLCALLNAGPEMEKLTFVVTAMEASVEALFQFLLAVYIILSRNDRTPSNVQLASLAASLVTLVKHQIVLHLSHTLPLMDKLSKAFVLFPVFLTCAIFKLGSIAVICAVMRFMAIPVLYAAHLLLLGICWCAGKKNLIDGAGVHTYRLAILLTKRGAPT